MCSVASPRRAASEDACARRILTTIARGAYRRPLRGGEIDTLLTFYRDGRKKGTFETGVQLALRRVLASPNFVFRAEEDPAGAKPGTSFRVSDHELANRLSFFLWSSMPDDQLFRLAEQGQLRKPEVLDAQVRRMIADPRADALMQNFAGQWLHVRNLQNVAPNTDEFPDFDNELRDGLRREIELFFGAVLREDRIVLDLLTADDTFVNERLAKHYGIPYVYGSQFRRVTVPNEARRGLLGKGSILLATSHADRTAPVLRGKWILENLLGTPPPPPPADVPPLEPTPGKVFKTMRERMAMHRDNPACAGCHRVTDPLGFVLENFDGVGAFRVSRERSPRRCDRSRGRRDARERGGRAAPGPPETAGRIHSHAHREADDLRAGPRPGARTICLWSASIVRDASKQDYRFSPVFLGIVEERAVPDAARGQVVRNGKRAACRSEGCS